MDQCSSNRVPVFPLAVLSSHNSSARSETERSSVQSSGLEQDNETLRGKLRQTREENARLIAANNELNTELETARYELHRSANKVLSLEQSVQHRATELVTVREYMESERSRLEQELSEWKYRANESCEAAARSADTVQQLHSQLDEVKKLRKRVEGERDLALDSAERIQKAYEDFQYHVHDRMQLAQQQVNSTGHERDRLCNELTNSQAVVKSLQEEIQQRTRDCSGQRDAREHLERLNADIRAELSQASVKVAELETKLSASESLQRENSDLKLTVEHQRVRLERCQAEIGESRAELGQLEDLAQRLQHSMSAAHSSHKSSKRSSQTSGISCLSTLSVKDDSSDVSNLSALAMPQMTVNELKTKVAILESELQQARKERETSRSDLEKQKQEVKRLKQALDAGTEQATGAIAEMADIGAKTVRELELSLTRLEDDREKNLSTISSLESRIADLEARKAAADAELTQRGHQLETCRQELADYGTREAALTREIRKQTLQIASLERQLDEKVSEVTIQLKRAAVLGDEVQSLSCELRGAREERDEQSRVAIENASACSQMRQLHDAQCRQMEASIAGLSQQNQLLEAAVSQSGARCAELQQSLAEMTEQTNALRLELSRREQDHQHATEVLESRAAQAEDLVSHLETELHCHQSECQQLQGQCSATTNELRTAREQMSKLNEMLEDKSRVEAQLKTSLQEQKGRTAEIETLSEHANEQLRESETKLTELECEQVRLLSQIAQSEHALQCKTAEYNTERAALEKRLSNACSELERSDERARELSNALHSAELERSRMAEDLGGQLKAARKQLKQQSKMSSDLEAEISQLKAELDLSAATCEEKDAKMKTLSERLQKVEGSLESVSSERSELLTEVEQLKLTAKKDLAQKLEDHDSEVSALRGEMEAVRVNLRRCEDALRSKEKETESLTASLQDRQWELQQRAAQLTQLDMAMKDRSSDWDQRLIRVETSLKKSRLETEQRMQQVRQLEEQVVGLMAALKEKTTKMQQLELQSQKQASELETKSHQADELERLLSESRQDSESATAANREAENQLSVSRSHLETLQSELSDVRSTLATTTSEHDRLARDLAEAVSLLQAKDAEHDKLVQQLAEAGEDRSRLQTAAALDSRSVAERHQSETTELRRQLAAARDDLAQLQQQLADAGERQAALVVELRRMAQQLSSGQMELEASRAIASAQRETILVREAEIARLEARLGLVERSLQQSASRLQVSADVRPPGTASSLPDVDPSAAASSLVLTGVPPSIVNTSSAANDVQLPASLSMSQDDTSPRLDVDNPDSLLAIWHQLQLNDATTHQSSAGDATTAVGAGLGSSIYNPRSSTDAAAAVRLGGAFEEKARVQDRVKALIGYREPTKKPGTSAAAGKPRMSVRPQPLSGGGGSGGVNHSRSSTVSTTSVKQQRRVSASESVNTSQLSTAVSRYANSISDRVSNG